MKWVICMFICLSGGLGAKPPNIIFILTDDQDTELGGQIPIKKTRTLIGDQGIVYENMFVSSPLCCPSRSSIFSGKYVHNHHGVNNSIEGGCSSSFWQQREEPNAFPVFLKRSGYNTMFAGKYLNEYGSQEAGGVGHIPPGWDSWYGLLDEEGSIPVFGDPYQLQVGNSRYYNYQVSVNGTAENHGDDYSRDYFTNYINRKAEDFLSYQNQEGKPFFMMLSTPACHDPFTPADPYKNNFSGQLAPRYGSYNITPQDKHWLLRQTIIPLPNDSVTFMDNIFVNRWRTLLSVDDMVENVYNILNQKDLLNDTFIFYSSDNGFHLGQFGLTFDKRQLYEFDIRVPLMIRGPGIEAGQTSQENVMNIDLGPTFIDLASQPVPQTVDGQSLRPTWTAKRKYSQTGDDISQAFREVVLIEHYGEHTDIIDNCPQYTGQGMEICDAHCVCEDSWNNTFSCVRSTQSAKVFKYCIIKEIQDFIEVYDVTSDRFEFVNQARTADPDLVRHLQHDLDHMMSCSGDSCCIVSSGQK